MNKIESRILRNQVIIMNALADLRFKSTDFLGCGELGNAVRITSELFAEDVKDGEKDE